MITRPVLCLHRWPPDPPTHHKAKHIVMEKVWWQWMSWAVYKKFKMYYVPKTESSLGRVFTLKFAWDRISGTHCLLLPQQSEIFLGQDISYSLFTTSPEINLDRLLHVVSNTPDPVKQFSRSSSSLKKTNISFFRTF